MLEEKKCQGSCHRGRRYCSLSDHGDQDRACSKAGARSSGCLPLWSLFERSISEDHKHCLNLDWEGSGRIGSAFTPHFKQNPWAISVPLGLWVPSLHSAMDGGWVGGQTL